MNHHGSSSAKGSIEKTPTLNFFLSWEPRPCSKISSKCLMPYFKSVGAIKVSQSVHVTTPNSTLWLLLLHPPKSMVKTTSLSWPRAGGPLKVIFPCKQKICYLAFCLFVLLFQSIFLVPLHCCREAAKEHACIFTFSSPTAWPAHLPEPSRNVGLRASPEQVLPPDCLPLETTPPKARLTNSMVFLPLQVRRRG